MVIDPHHPNIKAQEIMPLEPAPQSRVFVTQATNLDLVKATLFGELYPLVPERMNIVMQPDEVISTIRDGLKDLTPEDYLLPTGDPVIIGLSFSIAAAISKGHLRILKWDRQLNDYYAVRLNLNDR